MAAKYSRLNFDSYKVPVLTDRERHLQKLKELIDDEHLTEEEWKNLGLPPMPSGKHAAKWPESTHSQSTSPEVVKVWKEWSVVIPVVKLPDNYSVSLEADTRVVSLARC